MERERRLGVLSPNLTTRDRQSHQLGASSEAKVENEEMSLSLSQWLQPSKLPLSYLALLNEESPAPPDAKPPLDYAVKKVVLSNRDAATGPGGGIRTLYSALENEGACSDRIGSSKVKPSIRVQSCTNNDLFGSSSSKVPVARRSSRKPEHPSSRNYSEGSGSKVPMFGQSSRKPDYPSPHNYSEKLRSWKARSNRNINTSFSQNYSKYRDAHSKQSNRYKKSYSAEIERKQRIVENIKALGELLPHEVEGTPDSILNDVIDHVKLLQLQMKELTRSRLGGEPVSHHMIPIEGYGHFINQEEEKKKMTKPLEEIMADLLANDPDAADTLLESKGLYLLPFSSLQGFC